MRFRRNELNLSQTEVADELEVTFQQVQKYESGRNRIAASRLAALSKLLKVTPGYFFKETDAQRSLIEAGTVIDLVVSASSKDGVRLNGAFRRIANTSVRKAIIALIEAIGGSPG